MRFRRPGVELSSSIYVSLYSYKTSWLNLKLLFALILLSVFILNNLNFYNHHMIRFLNSLYLISQNLISENNIH